MMSRLFVVVLRVQQSLRLHRTSGPRSFVLRQAFAWNPHSLGISPQGAHLDGHDVDDDLCSNPYSLGISPQEAHLEDEMLMVMIRLEICQKNYTTEDFRLKNLHRKRVIFDIC